jgi:sodium-dependent dicarboxylate transporter 2/3/5
VVALLSTVVLTTTGVINRDDLGTIEWNVLILIAGGISLGTGMQLTGLDRVVVQWLPDPAESASILLVALVLATVIVGTFMSNTAAANLFLPIGISSAAMAGPAGGLHPVQIAVSIALVASMSMALPVSTPPNAMAYARNEFTTRDMVRVSFMISTLGVVAIIAGGGWIMRMWGMLD